MKNTLEIIQQKMSELFKCRHSAGKQTDILDAAEVMAFVNKRAVTVYKNGFIFSCHRFSPSINDKVCPNSYHRPAKLSGPSVCEKLHKSDFSFTASLAVVIKMPLSRDCIFLSSSAVYQ